LLEILLENNQTNQALEIAQSEKAKIELQMSLQEMDFELNNQKKKLETAFLDLHQTQVQLVHSKNITSLWQLTAGIAISLSNIMVLLLFKVKKEWERIFNYLTYSSGKKKLV